MNSRKSQIFGQVFIYILAIIIFSLVLLYGYKAIKDFSNRAEDVTMIQLVNDIKKSVKNIDYDSVIKKEFSIPGKYDYVCFVSLESYGQASSTDLCNPPPPTNQDYHPAVCNSWTDETKKNMFLITAKEEIESHNIGNIKISAPYYECIEINQGKIVLKLTGKGDHVELSEWL